MIPHIGRIGFDNEDALAVGFLVMHWAHLEARVAKHVEMLAENSSFTIPEYPRYSWKSLCNAWKDAAKHALSQHPEYLEIDSWVRSRAKELAHDRDAMVHYAACRPTPDSKAIHFSYSRTFEQRFEDKTYTREKVGIISGEILRLFDYFSFFSWACGLDIYPSTHTVVGPRPAGPILRTRPNPTIAGL